MQTVSSFPAGSPNWRLIKRTIKSSSPSTMTNTYLSGFPLSCFLFLFLLTKETWYIYNMICIRSQLKMKQNDVIQLMEDFHFLKYWYSSRLTKNLVELLNWCFHDATWLESILWYHFCSISTKKCYAHKKNRK